MQGREEFPLAEGQVVVPGTRQLRVLPGTQTGLPPHDIPQWPLIQQTLLKGKSLYLLIHHSIKPNILLLKQTYQLTHLSVNFSICLAFLSARIEVPGQFCKDSDKLMYTKTPFLTNFCHFLGSKFDLKNVQFLTK